MPDIILKPGALAAADVQLVQGVGGPHQFVLYAGAVGNDVILRAWPPLIAQAADSGPPPITGALSITSPASQLAVAAALSFVGSVAIASQPSVLGGATGGRRRRRVLHVIGVTR